MKNSHEKTVGRYLLQLFAWDGLLPPVIWLVPLLLRNLMPRNDAAVILMTVLMPIGAVFVRHFVGMRYIRENNCGPIMRRFQICLLYCAIIIMILADTLSIAMQDIVPFAEQIVFAFVAFVFYLPLMAIALYPGFPNRSAHENAYAWGEATRVNAFGGEDYE